MKPSLILSSHDARIRALVSRYKVVNPRIFGSVLYGTDEEGSDLDLLVDPLPGTTLFDLGGLQIALEDLLRWMWSRRAICPHGFVHRSWRKPGLYEVGTPLPVA